MHFECEVQGYRKNSERIFKGSRILNAIHYRFLLISNSLKIPKSTNKQLNIIFLLNTDPLVFLLVWIVAKLKKLLIISERNEYPVIIRNDNSYKVLFYRLFILWWQYKILDGFFLMTEPLINFYSAHVRKNCIIQLLPMTVDFNRFTNLQKIDTCKYLFYAGSLSQKKDGIISLIRAFNDIEYNENNLELWIAGGVREEESYHHLKSLIAKLELEKHIKLLGTIDRNKIPQLISNALILVLPRPKSIQAQGGFPTKLGEYLASGKPVIATRVGEIPKYLNEDEVFFISSEHIEKGLVNRINRILSDYDKALIIGEKGKEKAFEYFSTTRNAEKIKILIDKIAQKSMHYE